MTNSSNPEPSFAIKAMAWGIVSLIAAFPVALLLIGAWQVVRVQRAASYATAVGEVLQTDVEAIRDDGTGVGERATYTYRPRVRYAYSVAGVRHVGSQVTVLGEASSEAWAQGVAAQFAPGQQVDVRYDPAHPERTYLIAGGSPVLPWVLILMGGLPITYAGLRWWRQRPRADD